MHRTKGCGYPYVLSARCGLINKVDVEHALGCVQTAAAPVNLTFPLSVEAHSSAVLSCLSRRRLELAANISHQGINHIGSTVFLAQVPNKLAFWINMSTSILGFFRLVATYDMW
jgi:hypothetical protein